ncbi:MAG TPA: GNAT family N-acetyltransferase [Thermoanaerobaculia bacterium]|jgi:GNAT superfamily N-acetyltransferase|nr:GNAT family N-acetyltransferase [Thermoanaerobaculia bacterium]
MIDAPGPGFPLPPNRLKLANLGCMERLTFAFAASADAPALAALHTAVAERLTRDFGRGHWSSAVTEKGVLRNMEHNRVLVAREGDHLVGTLSLVTKKPWAIDPAYFTAVRRPVYLLNMAVDPDRQRTGLGRLLVEEAKAVARAWPAEAIRLDAYDAEAGAGGFYARCGFREVGRVVYRTVPLVYFEALISAG